MGRMKITSRIWYHGTSNKFFLSPCDPHDGACGPPKPRENIKSCLGHPGSATRRGRASGSFSERDKITSPNRRS